jgi:hypothetical protein
MTIRVRAEAGVLRMTAADEIAAPQLWQNAALTGSLVPHCVQNIVHFLHLARWSFLLKVAHDSVS